MTTIGVNILAPWVHDRARMYGWLAQAKPGLIVVCDEPDVAVRCKMAAPGALVAHRWVYQGDDSVGNMTPGQWAARFLPALPAGIAGYAMNEPSGDWRAISQWCADVMSIAAVANKPLIVGNLSVGNPPEAAIDDGAFDVLLRAFNDFPLHRFGLHEYFVMDPAAEPYRVGRYKALQGRAKEIGARAVRFVMTEAGRDVNGGSNDGWQSVMSADEYAKKLTQQAGVYEADDIDMAVFCYGEGGAGAWRSFDIQQSEQVLATIVDYNSREVEEVGSPPGYAQITTNVPGINVNVRSGPSLTAQPFSTVKTGDWVRPQGAPVAANGHKWQRVVMEDCKVGYVSLNVLRLSEVTK